MYCLDHDVTIHAMDRNQFSHGQIKGDSYCHNATNGSLELCLNLQTMRKKTISTGTATPNLANSIYSKLTNT